MDIDIIKEKIFKCFDSKIYAHPEMKQLEKYL